MTMGAIPTAAHFINLILKIMITVTFDAEKLIGNEWILNPVAVLSTPDQTEEKTVCIQFGWLKWLLTIAVAYKGKAKIG